MKIEEFTMIIGKAKLVFPNFTLTPEVIKAWFDLFQEEPAELFHTAMRAAVKEPGRAFFPTPGEVQTYIVRLRTGEKPSGDEVWVKLLACAAKGDELAAARVVDGNPAGQKALRRVTFHSLRYANIETELPWVRKEFIQSYDDHTERAEKNGHIELTQAEAKDVLGNLTKAIADMRGK